MEGSGSRGPQIEDICGFERDEHRAGFTVNRLSGVQERMYTIIITDNNQTRLHAFIVGSNL